MREISQIVRYSEKSIRVDSFGVNLVNGLPA